MSITDTLLILKLETTLTDKKFKINDLVRITTQLATFKAKVQKIKSRQHPYLLRITQATAFTFALAREITLVCYDDYVGQSIALSLQFTSSNLAQKKVLAGCSIAVDPKKSCSYLRRNCGYEILNQRALFLLT